MSPLPKPEGGCTAFPPLPVHVSKTCPACREFHQALPKLLKPEGLYSFFNGLAADNAFFHSVCCRVVAAELQRWAEQRFAAGLSVFADRMLCGRHGPKTQCCHHRQQVQLCCSTTPAHLPRLFVAQRAACGVAGIS